MTAAVDQYATGAAAQPRTIPVLLSAISLLYLLYLAQIRLIPPYDHIYLGSYPDRYPWASALTKYGAIGCFALYLAGTWPRVRQVVRESPLLMPAIAWLCFPVAHSAVFSPTRYESLQASTDYVGILLMCLCFHIQRDRSLAFMTVGALIGVVLVSSLIALAFPQTSWMVGDHAGRFRGFFVHKNQLGYACLLLLCFVTFDRAAIQSRSWRMLAFVLLAALLAASEQSAAYLGFGLLLMLLAVRRVTARLKSEATILAGILALSMIVAALMIANVGPGDIFRETLSLVGRDETLSGRDKVWRYFWIYAAADPIFGIGFRTLFFDPDFLAKANDGGILFHLGTMHSSYLELYVSFGILGVLAFLFFIGGFTRSLLAVRIVDKGLFWTASALLILCLAGGMQGSVEMLYPGFPLAMLCMVYFACTSTIDRDRAQARLR